MIRRGMRTPASASANGQSKIQANGNAYRGKASAASIIATAAAILHIRPVRSETGRPSGTCTRPSRTAGRTVAKQIAANALPAHGSGETPTYHQFRRRRSSSSNRSQKTTLAAPVAIQSPGVASGVAPRLHRARPSSATSTPAHASGNRTTSAATLKCEAARMPAITPRPQRNSITRRPYTKRERRIPGGDPAPASQPAPGKRAAAPHLLRRRRLIAAVRLALLGGAARLILARVGGCVAGRVGRARVRVHRGSARGAAALRVPPGAPHHFDLVGAVRRRVEAGADLGAFANGRDAGGHRLSAAEHLRLRVHRQRHAAGGLVERDAVLVDAGDRAGHGPEAALVRRGAGRGAGPGAADCAGALVFGSALAVGRASRRILRARARAGLAGSSGGIRGRAAGDSALARAGLIRRRGGTCARRSGVARLRRAGVALVGRRRRAARRLVRRTLRV